MQNEVEAGGASTSSSSAEEAACDGSYVDAFMSVLHSLLTLFTAPGPSSVPAEGWVIPSMLEALSCTTPAFYDSLTTMLKMLDIYLEVSGPACMLFLERGGCARVLEAAERMMTESNAFITAAETQGVSVADSGWPPTDLGTVPASNRNFVKVWHSLFLITSLHSKVLIQCIWFILYSGLCWLGAYVYWFGDACMCSVDDQSDACYIPMLNSM